jgi:hypothetical protein
MTLVGKTSMLFCTYSGVVVLPLSEPPGGRFLAYFRVCQESFFSRWTVSLRFVDVPETCSVGGLGGVKLLVEQ